MKENIEVEHDARMTYAKTRLEISQQIDLLRTFNGTKEQEKKKVEELNQKYGESFGYHQTTAQWYDVLVQKGQTYAQVLFLQAKMQTLANRAAENQVKADELERMTPSTAPSSLSWGGKALVATAGFMGGVFSLEKPINAAGKVIDDTNLRRWNNAIKDAKTQAENDKKEMEETLKALQDLQTSGGIGGHVKPSTPKTKNTTSKEQTELKAQLKAYDELKKATQEKIEQNAVDLIQDEYARRRAQVALEHKKALAQIEEHATQQAALYAALKKKGVKVDPNGLQQIKDERWH